MTNCSPYLSLACTPAGKVRAKIATSKNYAAYSLPFTTHIHTKDFTTGLKELYKYIWKVWSLTGFRMVSVSVCLPISVRHCRVIFLKAGTFRNCVQWKGNWKWAMSKYCASTLINRIQIITNNDIILLFCGTWIPCRWENWSTWSQRCSPMESSWGIWAESPVLPEQGRHSESSPVISTTAL